MKRTGIYFAATMLALGTMTAARSQQRMIADEVVAVVGNSMILYSDVVGTMRELVEQQRLSGYTSNRDPQCEAIEMLLMEKMLANQARIDSLEGNPGQAEERADLQLDQLMQQFGSMLALETAYRKPAYQIREDLVERYTDMMLAQTMEYSIRDQVSVIPSEVERFFRRIDKDSLPMVPEQYVYAQIVMFPPSMEEAKLRARERLLGFRERILNGDNFGALARAYSQDGSASRGGEMAAQPKEAFVRPFAEAVEKLKPGQVSPVVETEFGFHLVEVLEQLGRDYRVRHILIKPEFTIEEMTQTAQRLDSIAGAIRSGEMTFESAALRFSQDNFSKYNGGEVTNREVIELMQESARRTSNRFSREDLGNMGDDYSHLRPLKPGEVSESYAAMDLRGNQQIKLVMLKEIIPTHRADLNEDYAMIEDAALAEKQQRLYDEWLQKKIAAMHIRIEPKYRNCDFENKGWIK
jgi:peptidyl-prolyl cis-trans isomerase SurA